MRRLRRPLVDTRVCLVSLHSASAVVCSALPGAAPIRYQLFQALISACFPGTFCDEMALWVLPVCQLAGPAAPPVLGGVKPARALL